MELYEAVTGMKIFFDFDGTLIDSKKRMYELFKYLVPESSLTYDEYWILKSKKIDHREILIGRFSYSDERYKIFLEEWMKSIELPEWLALDRPFPGITDVLLNLSRKHQLYIITSRQFPDLVLRQIEDFGWSPFFEEVFVTGQKKEKFELLKNLVIEKTDWFVGDTGHDIQTGKQLGMKTAAVLSGFLNKEKLKD